MGNQRRVLRIPRVGGYKEKGSTYKVNEKAFKGSSAIELKFLIGDVKVEVFIPVGGSRRCNLLAEGKTMCFWVPNDSSFK